MRGHMVVRGRRRDTVWFAVGRGAWEGEGRDGEDGGGEGEGDKEEDGKERKRRGVREAYEMWLSPGNFDEEGQQRRGLREIREGG